MKRIFEIKFGEKSPIHIDIPETEEEKQMAKKKTKKVIVGGAIGLTALIAGGLGAKTLYDRNKTNSSDEPAALPDGNDDENEPCDPIDNEDEDMEEINEEENEEESETNNEEEA